MLHYGNLQRDDPFLSTESMCIEATDLVDFKIDTIDELDIKRRVWSDAVLNWHEVE